jgi:3-oxoadipate enol-lactonase
MAAAVEKAGMSAIVDAAVKRIFTPEYLERHPEAVPERREVLLRTDPSHFAAACRALATVDLRPLLGRIANPTLVVVGTLDAATPPELARELAAGIRGATLREIPDCGHCPPLQEPQKFLAAVRDFLDLPGGES